MAATQKTTEAGARKSNLAFTFLSLEPERREAMDVFYRFCRETDDIADDPDSPDEVKAEQLEHWRARINGIYDNGLIDDNPLAASLAPIVERYSIPRQHFLDILDGLKMDIGPCHYATWQDLQRYCYGVASAVGLVCIRIFGCTSELSADYALNLGYALQFTNILRDVVEDYAENRRIYLPRDEMEQCGVEEHFLADPSRHPQCQRLFYIQYFRARHFFNRARRCIDPVDREALRAALIMARFYEEILEMIRRRNFVITPKRIRLSKPRKLLLLRKVLRQLKSSPPQALPGPSPVTVLGSGIAGMTAAVELAYQGYNVDVWEAKGFHGGRAHSLVDKQTGLTIDNGQHIAMGCYHSFLRMVDRMGSRNRLSRQAALTIPWRDRQQNAYQMTANRQLGPAHLLVGLIRFKVLSWRDRLAIIRLGLKLKNAYPQANETAAQWLERHKQTPGAIRALWEPFAIAALNEPLDCAAASLLHETLLRSLFGSPADAALIFAERGLSDIFEPQFEELIKATGGTVHKGRPVRKFEARERSLEALHDSRGQRAEVATVVSALPWGALASLLPGDSPLAQNLKAIPARPIVNIHLLIDRPLFEEPFVGLLDSPFDWIFDRSHTLPQAGPSASPNGQHLYAVTQSAPGEWAAKPSREIIDAVCQELEHYFPAAKKMTVLRSLVIKTMDATFAASPQFQPPRLSITPPWDNLIIAGDWTHPKLPATLEAAAESGFAAAKNVAGTLLP